MASCEIGSGYWPSLQRNDKVNKFLLVIVDKLAITVYPSDSGQKDEERHNKFTVRPSPHSQRVQRLHGDMIN